MMSIQHQSFMNKNKTRRIKKYQDIFLTFLISFIISSYKLLADVPFNTTTATQPATNNTPSNGVQNVPAGTNFTNNMGGMTDSVQALADIYNTEISDGPTFLKNVMTVSDSFLHTEYLAAFAATVLLPTKIDVDFATVCMQNTTKGVYRVHSQNPAAIGILKTDVDMTAYYSLFKLSRGDTFNYNIPSNANGATATLTYYGQIFLKHGDGKAIGDTICFARYR